MTSLRRNSLGRGFGNIALLLAAGLMLPWPTASVAGEEVPASPQTFLVPVPLPITGLVDTQVMSRVDRILKSLNGEGPRAILIFEFNDKAAAGGQGSDFGRAQSLARFLSGERLAKVRTVAYLPATVKGHAVLPVLACEQIVMSPDADLGSAGIDESSIDPALRRGYVEIAERRRTIPPALALGMLDKSLTISRVQTADGSRFVLPEELQALQQQGVVLSVETVNRAGDEGLFSGRDLRLKYGLVSHLVRDHTELTDALELPRSAVQGRQVFAEGWKPMRVTIDGPIHPRLVTRIIKGIEVGVHRRDLNLLLIRLRSAGGNLEQSLRLANYLASDLNRDQVRVVVFVDGKALSDAALIAFAADEVFVGNDAVIGGPGDGGFNAKEVESSLPSIKHLAEAREREWSLLAGLLDSKREVFRFTRAGRNEVRFFSEAEHAEKADADAWTKGPLLTLNDGLSSGETLEAGLAAASAESMTEVERMFSLDSPVPELRLNWVLAVVEFLADPKIAMVLLFIAWAALMVEMSSPGLGAPGFISALCFLLYFWAHFLHGTAGVLEILLFIFGMVCIGIEVFVIPGVGVFGFGGACMVLASIVLASQSFVIPTNAYQLKQMPMSLGMVIVGMSGAGVAGFLLRRYLPNTPYLNRLLLRPPQGEHLEEIQRREAFVEWNHLLGKRGEALTPLVPSGRIRVGDDLVDVISDGELIEKGSLVEVLEVSGSRVIVRKLG